MYYPLEDPAAAAANPLAALFSGDKEKKATKWEKLSLLELEMKLAARKKTGAMSLLMPAVLSWGMKVHYLAASQVSKGLVPARKPSLCLTQPPFFFSPPTLPSK